MVKSVTENMCTQQGFIWQFNLIWFIFKAFFVLSDILISHCTSLSPWFIILDKNNFVKVSHHYLTSGGYQIYLYGWSGGRFFLTKIFQKAAHQSTHKSSLFPYKQITGRNGDHEWRIMWFIMKSSEKSCS